MHKFILIFIASTIFCFSNLSFANTTIPKVNINAASARTLAKTMKGIGVKRAEAILEFRRQNGPFASLDMLQNIPGFSKKFVAKYIDQWQSSLTCETK